jgi:hypothetical protein
MESYLTSLADHFARIEDDPTPTDSEITATALRVCASLLTEGAADAAARHLRDLCERVAQAQVWHSLDVASLNTRVVTERLRAATNA